MLYLRLYELSLKQCLEENKYPSIPREIHKQNNDKLFNTD